MPTATLVGSTGLVGSFILSHLVASPAWSSVTTISRRAPKSDSTSPASTDASLSPSSKLSSVIEPDASLYGTKIPESSNTVFSALGTTRAAAGGLANQWKIDHDANVSLAKAAKAAGVKTFVFISSAGTRSVVSRMIPYGKMKNGVEDAIREQDFDYTVILRPGAILGEREQKRAVEGWAQSLVRGIGSVFGEGAKNILGQEADVIARAAVRAAEMAAEGKAPSKYWILEAADIIKYGKQDADSHAVVETTRIK